MEGFNVDWFVVISALLFVCFDFLTGIIKAKKNKKLYRSIKREGLLQKTDSCLLSSSQSCAKRL